MDTAALEKILGTKIEESEEEKEQKYQDIPRVDLIKELLQVKVSSIASLGRHGLSISRRK